MYRTPSQIFDDDDDDHDDSYDDGYDPDVEDAHDAYQYDSI